MHRENPLWGAPRIHGELLMIGIQVSESTVSNYLATLPRRRPSRSGGQGAGDSEVYRNTLIGLLRKLG
jgi:hypothetical protein